MTDESIIDPAAGVVAEGAIAASLVGGRKRKRSFFRDATEPGVCSNCATVLHGRICHSCGQDSDDFHRPIWSLVLDILDGLFGFDGRFWRTLPPLIFRPGYITRHYLTGVRARYVQPFRLLIASSVLFFLVLFLTSGDLSGVFDGERDVLREATSEDFLAGLDAAAEDNPEAAAEIEQVQELLQQVQIQAETVESNPTVTAITDSERREQAKDQIRRYLLPENYPGEEAVEAGEPLRISLQGGTAMTLNISAFRDHPLPVRRFIVERAERIIDNPRSWTDAMQRWLPRLVFLLLPLYALMLAALQFWRRGLYLYDHLVVSLHFHSFLFIFLTMLVLAAPWISVSLATLIFLIWSNYYLYRLHRNVYGNGRFLAVVRTLTLDIAYIIVLSISLVALMIVGLVSA